MNPIILFSIATVINVTLSTIRAICTIKGGKWLSATMNALCYGFYPLIVMLTAKDTVSIVVNMIITALANFVCVWLIKLVEEKSRKDKLWKIECTIPNSQVNNLCYDLKEKIPFSAYEVLNSKYTVFNIYCKTQLESQYVKECLQEYRAKYFVSESKTL